MAVEYRRHLVEDYGEQVVAEFDNKYRQVSPVKDWSKVIGDFAI